MDNWHLPLNYTLKATTTTKEVPYNSTMHTKWHEKKRIAETDLWNSIFTNMFDGKRNIEDCDDVENRMDVMLRRRIQNLCNDEVRDGIL